MKYYNIRLEPADNGLILSWYEKTMKSEDDAKSPEIQGHDSSDHQKVFTWEQEDQAINELIAMQKTNIRLYREKADQMGKMYNQRKIEVTIK